MKIMRTIKKQMAISRNMNESLTTKTLRIFWVVVFLIKAARIGVKAMRCEELVSIITYKGKECFVMNWAHMPHTILEEDAGFYESNANSVKGLRQRFQVIFAWYCNHRLDISVQRKLTKEDK